MWQRFFGTEIETHIADVYLQGLRKQHLMPTAQKRWGRGTIFSYFSVKGADWEVLRFASVVWKDLGSATHLLTALNLFLITINYKYFCCYCQLLLLHLPLLLHRLLQIGSDSNSLCYVLWYDGKSHEAGASPTFPDERRGPRVAGLLQLSCRENFRGLQSAMRC